MNINLDCLIHRCFVDDFHEILGYYRKENVDI